jgi:4-amino-4-deoxy-L-arabinose transferase-like glycosyltransferase
MKILLFSLLSTIVIVVLVFVISKFLIPEFALHMTYPFRVLRGTENYEGETRGAEVFFIWERILLPIIFLSSATAFFLLRKRLRLSV